MLVVYRVANLVLPAATFLRHESMAHWLSTFSNALKEIIVEVVNSVQILHHV